MYWHGINDMEDLFLISGATIGIIIVTYQLIALNIECARAARMAEKLRDRVDNAQR